MAQSASPRSAHPLPDGGGRKREESVDITQVVDRLCHGDSNLVRHVNRIPCAEPLPSRDMVHRVVDGLRSVLFPGYFGTSEVAPDTLRFHLGHTLDWVRRDLRLQIRRGLAFACKGEREVCDMECEDKAWSITDRFLEQLPQIQGLLSTDVRAAYEGDPAAMSPDETIFSYPGVLAVTNYRIAHALHLLEVPVLPRVITEQAHSETGIDIHPGAQIDECFFIDHGTGVVVGETCIIGRRVRIYQGVTLGAKSFPLDDEGNPIKGIPRHPIIEDEVTIYSGATILGRITIGRGSLIGGNVWLTRSVAPDSRILNAPPRADRFQHGAGI